MAKPRILLLAGRYLPGYKAGGALRGIANLVASLGAEFEFLLLAYDRDLGESEPYNKVSYDDWMSVDNAQIRHIKPGPSANREIKRAISQTPHDLLYINSLFDPVFGFSMIEASQAPVLLAPHGQLNFGALSQKSFKKKAFLAYLRSFGKLRRVVWHSTDETETEDILREFPGTRRTDIELCPYLLPLAPKSMPPRPPKAAGELRVCFVSRISPKKNLLFAIQSLASVVGNVTFSIYGPVEDQAYWTECQKAIPRGKTVQLEGPVPHSNVHDVLSGEHLFYLPTFGENFGYAIYEALCAGCPALISDQTPWRDLPQKEAGWDLPLSSPEAFIQVIQDCLNMDQTSYTELSTSAWQAAVEHYKMNSGPDSYRRAFNRMVLTGAPV